MYGRSEIFNKRFVTYWVALIARLPSANAHGVNTLQSAIALFTEGFQTYAGKTNGIILRSAQNKPKEGSPDHV